MPGSMMDVHKKFLIFFTFFPCFFMKLLRTEDWGPIQLPGKNLNPLEWSHPPEKSKISLVTFCTTSKSYLCTSYCWNHLYFNPVHLFLGNQPLQTTTVTIWTVGAIRSKQLPRQRHQRREQLKSWIVGHQPTKVYSIYSLYQSIS